MTVIPFDDCEEDGECILFDDCEEDGECSFNFMYDYYSL